MFQIIERAIAKKDLTEEKQSLEKRKKLNT